MRLLGSLAFGLSLARWVAANDSELPPSANDTAPAPKRMIIEFDQGANHDALESQLASRKGLRIIKSFRSKIFSGVSVESVHDNVDTLEAIVPIVKVWKSKKVMLEHPIAPQESFSDDAAAPNYTIHDMTGVDKLHALGIFGRGAKVGVVDTGIDYNHPGLGGCFGIGCKVAGGYDFIGNSSYPYGGTKMPDDDPLDQRGHGTHVSGIIAGKTELFTGVAPEATLYAYKVFGNEESVGVWDEDIIDAFLRAEQDGVDIITASIIGFVGWQDQPWAVVGSRLVERGVVVICAAGNWGTLAGPFFHSSGASGEFVLSVASVQASQQAVPALEATFNINGESNTTKVAYYRYEGPWPRTLPDLPIVPFSGDLNAVDEACNPLPPDTRNFTDTEILLVRRGGCSEGQKQLNLEEFGAKYVLFYNNDEDIKYPSFYGQGLGGLIEKRAGEAIIKTIQAGGNVTAGFDLDPLTNYVGILDPASGKPSDFTSWGSLPDLTIKPDIAAPGGNIFSTHLGGGYETQSGTSQAAPYVAGIAALWIGKYGGRSTHGSGFAKGLVSRIIHSGNPVPGVDINGNPYGFLAPVMQIGNGLVDAFKVLQYNTTLSWAKFGLNDTAHFHPIHSVDITNNGPAAVTYNFGFVPAAGFEMLVPFNENDASSPRIKEYRELVPTPMVPEVTLPSGEFVVQPGETKTATFTFDYPKGLSNIPAYSGKIFIGGDNNEVLSVPYFGLASNLRTDLGGQFARGYPYVWLGPDYPYPTIEEKPYFNFNLSIAAGDYPKLYSSYLWGVREVRWDIFAPDWEESQWAYPPAVGQDGFVGSVAYYADSGGAGGSHWRFDPEKDDANDTVPFPEVLSYRNSITQLPSQQFWWLGKLANGSRIAVGNYTMRFGALLPFGDQKVSEDWDKRIWPFAVTPL